MLPRAPVASAIAVYSRASWTSPAAAASSSRFDPTLSDRAAVAWPCAAAFARTCASTECARSQAASSVGPRIARSDRLKRSERPFAAAAALHALDVRAHRVERLAPERVDVGVARRHRDRRVGGAAEVDRQVAAAAPAAPPGRRLRSGRTRRRGRPARPPSRARAGRRGTRRCAGSARRGRGSRRRAAGRRRCRPRSRARRPGRPRTGRASRACAPRASARRSPAGGRAARRAARCGRGRRRRRRSRRVRPSSSRSARDRSRPPRGRARTRA